MPQSLTIGTPPTSGAAKRQRSDESRDVLAQTPPIGQKLSNGGSLKLSVRVPPYLDKSKTEIASTFQDLEWKQRFRLYHALENPQSSPFRVDRSDMVISRNRYGNVQPWDQSRVKLATPIAGSDYVNASPIVLKTRVSSNSHSLGEKDVTTIFNETKYIATQGPKEGQYLQFWHMVMQETAGDVGVIIMLTPCHEAGKEKCAQYFPATMKDRTISLIPEDKENKPSKNSSKQVKSAANHSQDKVTLMSMTHDASVGCDVRTLELTINGKAKTIQHYLFNGWPDFGKPEAEDRIALLELTRRSKEVAKDGVRIVHCSAGVGRTGTFIALDFLVREIEEDRFLDITAYPTIKSPTYQQHQSDDKGATWGRSGPAKTPTTEQFEDSDNYKDDLVYSTVNALREQRMMMVMNDLQYAFLYEVVREVFWAKYRAKPEGAVVKGATETGTDLPKGKVVRIEGGSDETEGGSASEAETEIMDKDVGEGTVKDPYAAVAPPSIREGISKEA